MADISKIKIPNNNTAFTIKDNSQAHSDHRHYSSDIVPLVHKLYESTSYYATSATQEDATWYFIAVKPDSWYLPWRVDFKVRSYCPNYLNCDSITWSTVCGREQGLTYANWNERYDTGHYYVSVVPMKKAGFDAGYSHAIGISILYGGGYTTAAYYRTFELDYFKCENCTVTILDTPTKLAGWTGYSTTNFNGVANYDAVNRGLRESGDDNDGHYYARRVYSDIKAGSNKIFPYTFIMQNADGRWESIVTSSSAGTSKSKNSHGFLLGQIMYMSANATYNENDVVGTYCVNEFYGNLLDHRYSFNTANSATYGTTANKPVYIVGTIGNDGLFYLADKWWAQDLPSTDDGKLYMYIGEPYDYYRMEFTLNHPIYWYKNGAIRQFTQDASTVTGHTVLKDVPNTALFTDEHVTSSANHYTPSGGSAKTPTGDTDTDITNLASGSGSQVISGITVDAAGHVTGVTSKKIRSVNTTYANGTGITIGTGNAINHSNSVTAQTTQKVYPIKIDAQGHISAYGASPTTLSGYGITDAKIASGVITLGSNTITPLTSASTLDATKLSGTIPSGCYTDTKNTAGSTDTASKIFLVGATSQAANPQTYSQDTAYVGTDGHVYSNSKQVVNLSDTQALTNKTYNGYTLAAACAKAVVTSVDTSASLPTSNAVKTFVEGKGYVTTDTKNTAGSTDTSSKIYLIGATSQAANPQTYSDNEIYATSGVLTTKSVQVGVGSATMQYNTTTQSIDFVFT